MGLFEVSEIEALYAPFKLHEHTIREGYQNTAKTKIRWFVYVEKPEVQRRLETLFPGEWEATEPVTTYGTTSTAASLSIRIRGVSRGFNGAAEGTSADDAKGAATDAFRRTASMWGIAEYIYSMDFEIWTNSYAKGDWDAQKRLKEEAWGKFVDWFNRKFSNQPTRPTASQSQNTPPQSVVVPEPAITVANPPKSPVDALNGNGQQERRVSDNGSGYKLHELKNAVLKSVYNNNTFHMNGSLKKLEDAGVLHPGLSLAQAIQVVETRKDFEALPKAANS